MLLKNEDDILPVAKNAKIAVIGEFARTPDQLSAYPELAARIKKYQQLTTLN